MKNFIMIAAISLSGILLASEQEKITLPLSNVLYQRLRAINLSHFADKTRLHETLGGQTKNLPAIVSATNTAEGNYSKYMHKEYGDQKGLISDMYMDERKSLILESILQDHPEAIRHLKQ